MHLDPSVIRSTRLLGLAAFVSGLVLASGCSAPDLPRTSSHKAASSSGGTFASDDPGMGTVSPDSACATASAVAARTPVYLLFVVDASSSMLSDGKWNAQAQALDAIFDDMGTRNDPAVGAGVLMFSDQNDPTQSSGPYPSSADVPIRMVDKAQHDRMRARIDSGGPSPDGSTPTFAALSGGYRSLEAFTPQAPLQANGSKVLVLLTDGVPDGATAEQTQCVSAATREDALASAQGPIKTFAIGVGPFPSTGVNGFEGYDPAFLGQLARAGGTAPAGCDPASTNLASVCHFQVTPSGNAAQVKQSFIDAINKIRGAVASCEFSLAASGSAIDPTHVNVVYTDAKGQQHSIPQSATSGWTYDDPTHPTKVFLNGSACEQVKADASAKVSIVLGCATETR
jgi:hypothetical protein